VAGLAHVSIIEGPSANTTPVDINYLKFEFVYLDENAILLDVSNVLD
jgi:hypothetical protein